ncbi:MAG: HlyD family type I secretion periplasmic adaptor subunit [Epsilonproteobacteria bacterium]|nr:MAG: HlyD family type I secretion periplasmic adaptor subunit [Campylobacterota bacterium]
MKKRNWLPHFFTKKKISKEDYIQIQDENTPPPELDIRFSDSTRIILSGVIILVLFFGVGGLWITFAEISGAVIAPGEVRVDTERKSVQHLEGGIIRKILVRNGDQVVAGQPLLILDSSRIIATIDKVQLQLAAARLNDFRLQAEKALAVNVEWPPRYPEISQHQFDELLESSRKVFTAGRQALENQIDLLHKQADQLHQQDLSLSARLQAEEEIALALQEELDAKMVLFEQKYIDKTQILKLRRVIAENLGQRAQLHGSQAELREKIAEYQLRQSSLKNKYRQHAVERQAEVQQRVFDLQQQLRPLLDAGKRLTITAPVDGVVVAMQVHSEGGVIKPGQVLLDIVPKDSPLIVECHIMVKDIAHIFKGQEADVQLVAFPTRTTPKILGKIVYISADRILQRTPRGEQPSYVVYVELNKQQLKENNLYLTAGMPATVFIRTEPRTVLDYALEPLLHNFDRALREN